MALSRIWALFLLAAPTPAGATAAPDAIVIDFAHPTGRFDPATALGAGIDGTDRGGVARLFTPANLKAMAAAHLGPVTYRLRTELGIEAWHFSEEGSWSDPAHAQGYWTSSDRPKRPLMISWGYRLPRRGDTIDNANNDGFSRLDDGDPKTFWKSNPYLAQRYTLRPERPQWVVAAFSKAVGVDTATIDWAQPYARRFEVQYWVGSDAYDDQGRWVTFPHGAIADGRGGRQKLDLASRPIRSRFFRILLEQSSLSAPPGATDPRDALGYAIGEIALGRRTKTGGLIDLVRHGRSRFAQTVMRVSSTDPWHRAIDRDPNLEQPGLDLVFGGRLTRGRPAMIPVAALFGTPDDAAAEVRFLKRRGWPVARIEIGEEPDGQAIDPEAYGALYLQVAAAIRKFDATTPLGGPSLQSAVTDTELNSDPDRSWMSRFVRYLKNRRLLDTLQFVSFERYPFDDLCGDLSAKLVREDGMMAAALDRLRTDGVPASVPLIVSEYGFSAFGGVGEVEMSGALIDADIAAQFVSSGGHAAYLFGYGPSRPYAAGHQPCAGYGDLMLFEADVAGQPAAAMPSFYESRMLADDWAGHGRNPATAYPARIAGAAGRWIAAFPVRRADGVWSVLLLNRNPRRGFRVQLDLPGPFAVTQYGKAQYAWRAAGVEGHPIRDLPPIRFTAARALALAPWSLSVAVTRSGAVGPIAGVSSAFVNPNGRLPRSKGLRRLARARASS